MFKFSTRSKYGIRALVELALRPAGVPVPAAVISERRRIPKPFLEQILNRLNRAGIVESVRGPSGGFRLKKDPAALKLGEVIEALEKQRSPALCLDELLDNGNCDGRERCPSSVVCRHLDEGLDRLFDGVTLQKVVDRLKGSDNG